MNSRSNDFLEPDSRDYWRHLAVSSGMDFLDSIPQPELDALKIFSKEDAIKYRSIPLRCDSHSCTIAMSDPMNFEVLDSLSSLIKGNVDFIAAFPRDIDSAIYLHYK